MVSLQTAILLCIFSCEKTITWSALSFIRCPIQKVLVIDWEMRFSNKRELFRSLKKNSWYPISLANWSLNVFFPSLPGYATASKTFHSWNVITHNPYIPKQLCFFLIRKIGDRKDDDLTMVYCRSNVEDGGQALKHVYRVDWFVVTLHCLILFFLYKESTMVLLWFGFVTIRHLSTRARILVQVTIYRRLLIGRDGPKTYSSSIAFIYW